MGHSLLGNRRVQSMTKLRWTGICLAAAAICLTTVLVGWIVNKKPELKQLSEVDQQTLAEFKSLGSTHVLEIADSSEPGERLILCLTFVRKSDQVPLSNETISFYHTDANGDYKPDDPNDDSTAGLKGSTTTDDQGRLIVRTILPGDYGSSADNRHIHMTVPSAKPVAYDIHFSQYSTFMLRRFVASSDQHFLADLKRNDQRKLIAFVTIECKFNEDD